MKAATVTEYGEADVLEVTDRERPRPGEGEVLIEVEAAGINFADIMQRRGHYQGGPSPEYVPGMEVAGTIAEVGDGVNREAGEAVVSLVNGGGYAEYATADARGLLDIPGDLSFEEAAGFPVQWLTAHNCLHEWGGLEADETVLVHAAAGGVGSAAVQLADEAGAAVIGTASTEEKLSMASDLGMDHGIQYTEEDFVDRVNEITDGDGVDLVLDGIGSDTSDRSLQALRSFGRMVSYGAAGGEPGRPNTADLLFSNQRVIGYHLGRAIEQKPMKVMGAVPELTQLLGEGTLEVQVGHTFDLEEAASAHQFIEDRKSSGKVVLVP
ncbi:NADPH:quinone reductase [Natronomonas pharaonis DSM 2160]|uniref:NADPH:quinone reductase n=1 Tax=Natronomonas pharaonis (strain ATCC 35678 / DSM 2160 / CIP 103997 / JCM 8858 / NBRC 14720 / NCIMB 2260 / Gabara) TaxID=348780 RepID=A0A1U7EXQ1_NATPD|nr:NADPH:quinone oxidoreductase family protein [Natronomonas pharaonis]CAI49974.1 NADPH:quinone reductase [Natronomonas pharaonis DSM 2160]